MLRQFFFTKNVGRKVGTRNLLVRLLMRPRSFGLVILTGLLLIRIWDPIPVKSLRLQVFDYYQKIQPRAKSDSQVIVVDLDEASLAQYGQWPWPRTMMAQLITTLFNSGARAVGFDIIFAEQDRMSPGRIANDLVGLDEQTRDRLRSLPDNDATFADTLTQKQVVVSQGALPNESPSNPDLPLRKAPIAEIGGDPKPHLLSFSGLLRNIPELEAAAAGHGVITINPETDGVVRRIPALVRIKQDILPTLSLELLRVALGQSAFSVHTDFAGIRSVAISHTQIPTDKSGRIWINFAKLDRERYVSAKSLLNGTVAPQKLSGKLVLIGSSALGLGDNKATPIDESLPGVEIHAQILDMIQDQSFLTRPNFALAQELIIILLLGLFIIFLVPFFGAVQTLFLGACIAAGMVATSWYWYGSHGVLIDVSYGAVGIFGLYSLLSYLNYVREEFSRRQIRNMFSRYLSPTLVDQLTLHPGKLTLGGETKDMTVMFCDVRNFTGISEQFQSDPQGLTHLINRLMTPLTDAIHDHNGTIDKYMGDSIMAFWNAPLDDPDHATHACKAALAMILKLDELNIVRSREAAAMGKPFSPIKVGIGINTGICVVGNLGSEQRFDYSVLGDSVNIASRLEGQSKSYDLGIVIGPHTAELIKDDFAILEVDLITLKGKQEAARTYAVLGDQRLREDPDFQCLVDIHSAMLAAFRSQEWSRVNILLQECRNNPHALSGLYNLYNERMVYYQDHPPPSDWVGVFVATNK